jgi:hypothetical protein
MKTLGISPKVIASLVTGAVVAALAHFLHVDVSPDVKNAIGVVLVAIAGYIAPGGEQLEVAHVGLGNDAALPADAQAVVAAAVPAAPAAAAPVVTPGPVVPDPPAAA